MANSQRGEVSLDVGGKTYTLRPSFNAICAAEDKTGKRSSTLQLEAELGDMRATRALIWAFLQPCHGNEFDTLEKAGEFVDMAGGLVAVQKRLEALAALNQPPEDMKAPTGGTEDPPPAQAGTGDDSSLKPDASA